MSTFWDAFAPPLSRPGDPATSHQAADDIAPHVGALEQWAADCVRATPGLTQRELEARHCPTEPRKLGRRLCGAERHGLVRRGGQRACGISGRPAEVWYAVETTDPVGRA